jgi:uncharacterized membrane protein
MGSESIVLQRDTPHKTSRTILHIGTWLTCLCAVLGVAAFLRFHNLGQAGLAPVEVYVPGIQLPLNLSDPAPRFTLRDTIIGDVLLDDEPNPIGFYVTMLAWTKMVGTGIVALRLPSALFGVASVLLIYLLGLLERDKWTGLLAAGMLALNGYHIYWSQTAKMYAMGCFLGLLSTVLLLAATRNGRRQPLFATLYAIVTLAGLGTVVHFWLLFVAQICWVGLRMLKSLARPALLRWQLLVIAAGSPLAALAFFQARRASYLSHDILPGLAQFMQFGSLFEPDLLAVPPRAIPTVVGYILALFALGLVAVSLWSRNATSADEARGGIGPPFLAMTLVAVAGSAVTLRLAKFTYGADPQRARLVAAFGLVPVVIIIFDYWLCRHWPLAKRILQALGPRLAEVGVFDSASFVLVITPIFIMAATAQIMPLFAARTALLFTPYLLILVAGGVAMLIRGHKHWLVLVPALALVHSASVVYNQDAKFEHHTDYKGLAEQLIPLIQPADLVFIQRDFMISPIFYYLPATQYHFVASEYAQAVQQSPQARVWVLLPWDQPEPDAMASALNGFENRTTVSALHIKAVLYARSPGLMVVGQARAQTTSVGRYDVLELTYPYSTSGLADPWESATGSYVTAVFTSPSNKSLPIDGFFYTANTYKVRFAPAEVGTYSYTVTLSGGPDGTHNYSGSFASTASANRGFIRVDPHDRYRLITEGDGKLFFGLGVQDGWDPNPPGIPLLKDGTPGAPLYGFIGYRGYTNNNWNVNDSVIVSNDTYFKTYGDVNGVNYFGEPGAGFNLTRINPGNGVPTIYAGYAASGNKYDESASDDYDILTTNSHKYGLHLLFTFFERGLSLNTLCDPASTCDPIQTDETKRAIRYVLARWGAYTDIWELRNESNSGVVSSVWLNYYRNYLHAIDPYQRLVSNSLPITGDWNSLDYRAPHSDIRDGYNYAKGADFTNNFTTGRPVILSEGYNSNPGPYPWSPLNATRVRVAAWTSLFGRIGGIIWWNSSGCKPCGYPNGHTSINIYLGGQISDQTTYKEERDFLRVFSLLTTGTDANVDLSLPVQSNGSVTAYALLSSQTAMVYMYSNGFDSTQTPQTTSFNLIVPFAGTAAWIDPRDGSTIQTFPVNSGERSFASPSFTEDMLIKITPSGQPPPPTSRSFLPFVTRS